MSLFNALGGNVLKSLGGGGAHSGLAGEVLNMIGGGQGGGMAKLIRAFEGNGLGSVVQSWISTGQNLPVSADQITSVLGNAQIAQLGAKFGIAPEDVAHQLSRLLPGVVDSLTPHGSVPDADVLQEGLSLLRQHLG
jgi:uncharacterized protein YidB (DUF937 family)